MSLSVDSIEEEIVEEGAVSLFQYVSKILGTYGKRTFDKYAIKKAAKQYYKNYLFRHGQIKVLGMSEPISLAKIYTAVEVVDAGTVENFSTVEGLEKIYLEEKKRTLFNTRVERIGGIDVVNKYQFLNILGQPGSGKTTFLRKIGLEALLPLEPKSTNQSKRNGIYSSLYTKYIPVFIELRRLGNEKKVNILDAIKNEFSICGFPESEYFVKKSLEEGEMIILLDGLDEIPNMKLNQVIDGIKDFTNQYSNNKYVTSCRTAFYKNAFTSFKDVTIADFDEKQIKKYSGNWFTSEVDKENKTGNKFYKLLSDKKNVASYELARTPLLLTFLCLIYDSTQKLPDNRSFLYKKSFEILLEKWAAEKRIHSNFEKIGLNTELIVLLLSLIASKNFQKGNHFFYKANLVAIIKLFLEQEINITGEFSAGKILKAIEVQQGILVQRANDVYSFSHLTIQEYLTANYYNSIQGDEALISSHFFDPRWHEVFLLLSGLSQANKILLTMEKESKTIIASEPSLNFLLTWVKKNTEEEKDKFQALYHRLVSLIIAISAYRILSLLSVFNNNEGYESYVEIENKINSSMNKLLTIIVDIHSNTDISDAEVNNFFKFIMNNKFNIYSNDDLKYQLNKNNIINSSLMYFSKVVIIFKKTFTFNTMTSKLSWDLLQFESGVSIDLEGVQLLKHTEEVINGVIGSNVFYNNTYINLTELDRYLYGLELIVDAKKSALSVSHETWEEVCQKILIVD